MRAGDLKDARVDLVRDPATILWIQRFLEAQDLPRPVSITTRPCPGLDTASASTWFGAVDDSGRVHGCLRLISSPTAALPLLHASEIDGEAARQLRALGSQVSQVGDLAIAPGAPTVATVSVLARATMQHAVAAGQHSYLLAEVSERLIRFLRTSLNMSCEIVGAGRHYSDGHTWWPVLIDGVRWLHDLRFERPEQWRWFVDDAVVSVDKPQPEIDLDKLL